MQHRRRTGPAARFRGLRTALGGLLACCALGGTALAAAGGAASPDPAAAVLQVARQQIGDPYVWGGTGPDSWDCSGLTSRLWRDVGGVASIPRIAADQQAWAVPIPAEQAMVGDLVFFGNPVTHVALYAGNGTIVDASSSQHGVVERKIWTNGVIRYGRVPRPGMPAISPWTPPALPSPAPSTTPSATPSDTPSATPSTAPSQPASATPSATPSARRGSIASAGSLPSPTASVPATPSSREASGPAALASPLRGLPAPDLAAASPVAAQAAANATSVRGSPAWTDVELVRVAWRHAGGGALPTTRAALVAAGTAVPIRSAAIGDVVVYGTDSTLVGIYLGHGYMVDASGSLGRVVVHRVYAGPAIRLIRLPLAARAAAQPSAPETHPSAAATAPTSQAHPSASPTAAPRRSARR
ncbi:MAG: hypothetical protein NVSMB55_18390 [Mycobacteriales bacterium]